MSETLKIFLSCVSREFPGLREDLRSTLKFHNVDIHIQEDELKGTDGNILQTIDRYVQNSHLVIHLVGSETGDTIKRAEQEWLKQEYPDFAARFPFLADELNTSPPVLAYTQMEAWLALYHGKGCYECRAGQLDGQFDSNHPQEAHWERLKTGRGEHRLKYSSPEELKIKLLQQMQTWREQWLDTVRPNLILPTPKRTSPISLDDVTIDTLRYREQFLPYRKRERTDPHLDDFIEAPQTFLWWGIVGEGGVGKTRLAYEHALKLRNERNWDVGFLGTDQADHAWLTAGCKSWMPGRSTLIILDYAAQRSSDLIDGLFTLATRASDWLTRRSPHKLRILLLDRPGRIYPVSTELLDTNRGHDADKRDKIREHFFPENLTGTRRSAWIQDEIQTELRERETRRENYLGAGEPLFRDHEMISLSGMQQQQWRQAICEIIDKLGNAPTTVPDSSDEEWWDRVARLTGNGRPLFLQILGICLARQPELISGLTGEEGLALLLDKMLEREQNKRWCDLFPESEAKRTSLKENGRFQAVLKGVAFSTLSRGLRLPQDAKLLERLAGDLDPFVLLRILRHDEGDVPDTWKLAPLEPDLLGERLLLNIVKGTTDPAGFHSQPALVSPSEWIGHAVEASPKGTIETLSLLAGDFPRERECQEWIHALLDDVNTRYSDWSETKQLLFDRGLPDLYCRLCLGSAEVAEDFSNKFNKSFVRDESSRFYAFLQMLIELPQILAQQSVLDHFDSLLLALANADYAQSESSRRWLAQGAVNAISAYGTHEHWDHLERWGDCLTELAQQNTEQPEIQLRLAQGAFNAIAAYGTHKHWDHLERWGDCLTELARQNTEQPEIQQALAQGAVNAIAAYGRHKLWDHLERWGDCLKSALPLASIEGTLFQQMIMLAGHITTKEEPIAQAPLRALTCYWPGFRLQLGDTIVPLIFVASTDGEDRELGILQDRVQQWDQRITVVSESLNNNKVPDLESIVWLWEHRMCSPDRGDLLVPLLHKLDLRSQLEEAANDPWRAMPNPPDSDQI